MITFEEQNIKNKRNLKGDKAAHWRGGRSKTADGYYQLLNRSHPRSCCNGYVLESVLVAEKVLGKSLPRGAIVHHINHIRTDNRPENLIICQNSSYHSVLHRMERAYNGCGNAYWRKCGFCHEWDNPENMYISPNGYYACHYECKKIYFKQYAKSSKRKKYVKEWILKNKDYIKEYRKQYYFNSKKGENKSYDIV